MSRELAPIWNFKFPLGLIQRCSSELKIDLVEIGDEAGMEGNGESELKFRMRSLANSWRIFLSRKHSQIITIQLEGDLLFASSFDEESIELSQDLWRFTRTLWEGKVDLWNFVTINFAYVLDGERYFVDGFE